MSIIRGLENRKAGQRALDVNAGRGSDPSDDVMRRGLEAALQALP